MAGHSHSANIAHRKGLVDAKRGQLFTKLCRAVYVAARNGGGDPSANMRLRYAIDKARSFSVPKENIERSIKKATGELGAENFEEVVYEGYGPGGVAVLCEALTDNRNRTASELRRLFESAGGNLGCQRLRGLSVQLQGTVRDRFQARLRGSADGGRARGGCRRRSACGRVLRGHLRPQAVRRRAHLDDRAGHGGRVHLPQAVHPPVSPPSATARSAPPNGPRSACPRRASPSAGTRRGPRAWPFRGLPGGPVGAPQPGPGHLGGGRRGRRGRVGAGRGDRRGGRGTAPARTGTGAAGDAYASRLRPTRPPWPAIAEASYVPHHYPGRVIQFWCTEMPTRSYKDRRLAWSEVAGAGLEVHVIPGNHMTMLDEPHIAVLAEKLDIVFRLHRWLCRSPPDSYADDWTKYILIRFPL